MGMYTGIRFRGIVKKEFREDFKMVALSGNWEDSTNHRFLEFALNYSRSHFIPCGALCYMPESWETFDESLEGIERLMSRKDVDFPIQYNSETGEWQFQCSLKNYENEIEEFFKLLPYFIESIEHIEYFYEEDTWSQRYELVDGEVRETNDRFIKYGYTTEDENYWR